jgi:hypothetical protein
VTLQPACPQTHHHLLLLLRMRMPLLRYHISGQL